MSSIIHHSIIYALSRGAPGLINVLSLSIYSKLLTAEAYGQYAITFSIIVFIYSTFFQWINMSLSRFFPSSSQQEGFFKSILTLFGLVAALTGIISLGVIFFTWNIFSPLFLIICTGFLWGYAWFELTLELIRCRLSPLYYGRIYTLKALLTLGISIGLLLLLKDASSIFLGHMGGFLIVTLLFFKKDWHVSLNQRKSPLLMKDLACYGLPLIPTNALTVLLVSTDRLLLGYLLGTREAGLYATSFDLTASTMTLTLMVVSLAAYPFITKALEQEGISQTQKELSHYLHLLLAIGIPASTGFALISPNITEILLGKDFWEAGKELIPWISIIALFTGFRTFYLDLSFQLGKNTKKLIWVSIVGAIVNCCLNYLLIPYYGYMAVAYVGLITAILGCMISGFIGRRIFPLPGLSMEIFKIILASIIMISVLWPTRNFTGYPALVIQILLGIISYGVMAITLNILNLKEILFKKFSYKSS